MTPDSTEIQDAADMAKLVEGHETALNSLMERHGEKVFHYLIRQVQNEAEAADLAQETFVRVYQNRARFKPSARFTTWLYTIATNLARDRFRWRTRHPQVSLEAENPSTEGTLTDVLADENPGPSEELQRVERADAVRRVIARLPEDLRTALILFEYDGQSHAEIAAIAGCSVKAVESRLFRARQLLRTHLAGLADRPA
jgi:RNA polymerase sigma-70 factor (ECF subfamily)